MNQEFRKFRGDKGVDFVTYLEGIIEEKNLEGIEAQENFMNSFDYTTENRRYVEELIEDYKKFCEIHNIEPLNVQVDESTNPYVEVEGMEADEDDRNTGITLFEGHYESEEIEIPEFVEAVEDNFLGESKVKRVRVKGGSALFSYNSFVGNTTIEEVYFEEDYRGFGCREFGGCTSLRKLVVSGEADIHYIEAGMFEDCDSLEEIDIQIMSVDGIDFDEIAQLPKLRKLNIRMGRDIPTHEEMKELFGII